MTSHLRLSGLKVSGFRSFKDESSIVFPQKGLLLLHGIDIRHGGSNGSGKSSVLEAVYWILGLNKIPATELLNKHSESMSGELSLSSPSGDILVKRTLTKLSVTVAGVQIPGTKSDVEKKLYDLICSGLPDVLEVLSYRRQSSGGYFSSAEDQKIKSFLSTCIPSLDRLEAVHDESKAKIAVYRHEAVIKKTEADRYRASLSEISVSPDTGPLLDHKLSILTADLAEAKEAADSAHMTPESLAELELLQKQAAEYQAQIDEISGNEYKPTEAEFAEYSKLAELQASSSKDLKAQRPQILQMESQYSGLSSAVQSRVQEIADLVRPQRDIPGLESRIETLRSQIDHLNQNSCFTCHQSWESTPEKKDQLEKEKLAVEAKIREIKAGVSKSEALSRSLTEEKLQLSELSEALKELKAKERSLEIGISSLDSQIKAVTGAFAMRKQNDILKASGLKTEAQLRIQSILNTAAGKRSSIVQSLMSEISQVKGDIQRHQTLMARQVQVGEYLALAEAAQIQADKKADLEFEISDVSKKVNGLMIGGILSEVQSEANKMIGSIPSIADVSVSISTVEELKNGNSKVRIASTIYKSGTPMSFKILSGGQKSAVSLILDLAFISVISRRTSVAPGWIFLDEAMEGMDIASKESALDLIKSVSRDRLIIIVDHSTEIKEQFDHSVEISYDGVQSKVRQ